MPLFEDRQATLAKIVDILKLDEPSSQDVVKQVLSYSKGRQFFARAVGYFNHAQVTDFSYFIFLSLSQNKVSVSLCLNTG